MNLFFLLATTSREIGCTNFPNYLFIAFFVVRREFLQTVREEKCEFNIQI